MLTAAHEVAWPADHGEHEVEAADRKEHVEPARPPVVRPVPHEAIGMWLAIATTASSSMPRPREFRSPPKKSGASMNDGQAVTWSAAA